MIERAKQIKFREKDCEEIEYGILCGDVIVCACCGAIFDVNSVEILKVYDYWVDFRNEIEQHY